MISVLQLGTVDYGTGLRLQQQLVELRKQGKIGDVLLLLEHTRVITLGRNARASNVIASAESLEKRGVELFESDRGGDVTFHGPGQIVGYPIFDLRGFATADEKRKTLGVIEFVRRLEEVLIRTCADFAISTKRISGLTGVWTHAGFSADDMGAPSFREDRSKSGDEADAARLRPAATDEGVRSYAETEAKVAAIGVHISRFVTSHGFALNVNTDLSYFSLIVPCGIANRPVTSMQKELGRALDLNDVAESVSRNFGVLFQSQMLWLESLDALLAGVGGAVHS